MGCLIGRVGSADRACGNPYDVRRCFPSEHYPKLEIPEHALTGGDVFARAKMRADEVMQSSEIIPSLLKRPVETN